MARDIKFLPVVVTDEPKIDMLLVTVRPPILELVKLPAAADMVPDELMLEVEDTAPVNAAPAKLALRLSAVCWSLLTGLLMSRVLETF